MSSCICIKLFEEGISNNKQLPSFIGSFLFVLLYVCVLKIRSLESMVVVVGSSYKLFVKPQEGSRGRKYCGNKVTIVVRKTIKPEKRIVFVIHILGSFFPFDIYFLSFSLPNISFLY